MGGVANADAPGEPDMLASGPLRPAAAGGGKGGRLFRTSELPSAKELAYMPFVAATIKPELTPPPR